MSNSFESGWSSREVYVTTVEFVLEGRGLDWDEAARVVGVEPSAFRRADGDFSAADRWSWAVRGEPVRPSLLQPELDTSDYLGELEAVLASRVGAIVDYCRRRSVVASFRVLVDSTDEQFPCPLLTAADCSFLGQLRADLSFDIRTRPGVEEEAILDELDSSAGEASPAVSGRDGRTLVLAGRVRGGSSSKETVDDLTFRLAKRQAAAELGGLSCHGVVLDRDGGSHLFGAHNFYFPYVSSVSGDYGAVAVADDPVGFDVETTTRAFGPGLLERFAPDERDYVLRDRSQSVVPAVAGVGAWDRLTDEANRRALEVWAKKQAYLIWLGEWDARGLGGFSVLEPEALGVAFQSVGFPAAPDLIGWLCCDCRSAAPVEAMWVDDEGEVE
jgi:hypothetical protein